jgi:probable HAF family extracellular repeat protein
MRRAFTCTAPSSLLAVAGLVWGLAGCADLDPAGPDARPSETERLGPRGGGDVAGGRELVAVPLGTLGGAETMALAINDPGRVVGWSHNEAGATRPFIWTAAEGMRDLGTLGGDEGVAMAVNNAGTAVGWSLDAEGRRLATLWTPAGEVVRLGEHPFGDGEAPSGAMAINARGEAVGFTHGLLLARWAPDGRPLGMDRCSGGFAFDINDRGEVTGLESAAVGAFLFDPDLDAFREYSGFVWRERTGCVGLIDDDFLSHDAVALNNRGVVVGLGGEHRELDPPDPGTLLLVTSEVPFLFDPRFGFRSGHPSLPDEPRDINDRGVVVGDGIEGINRSGDRVGGAFLWTARPGAFGVAPAPVAREAAVRVGASAVVSADCPAPVAHLVRIGALPACP